MRTVGQVLKDERERKLYKLEDVEKVTKIRKELLEALEADDYTKLPPATFVKGFIKSYGKFLGLDPEKLLAIYRREFSEHKNPPRIMDALANPLKSPRFQITPTKLISGLVIALVLIFFGYLWYEYRYLVGAPYLEISQPQDQARIENSTVKVEGKTEPEAAVQINNQQVEVSSDGKFSQEVGLQDSANKLTVTATSKLGRSTKIERTVFKQ